MTKHYSKFLFFSPYAKWQYHTAHETTWAHGLRMRGAEARFVLCDELLPACDIFRKAVNKREPLSCLGCMSSTVQQFEKYRTPFEWLGSYLPREVRQEASSWLDGLPVSDLKQAAWKGRPVGQWAATSVFYQLRSSNLDMQDPSHVELLRQHLYGVVLTIEALTVLYDEYQPDTVVTLNGRFFTHWAAFELARERGIRVVTHERGLNKNTARFAENHRTHELGPIHELWEAWKDVPLNEARLDKVLDVLRNRCLGIDYAVNPFSPPLGAEGQPDSIRDHLGLDDRPLVAVFTSSNDETAAFADRCAGAFPDATDFLPATLELARQLPQIQFVIRVHPNVQSKLGTNEEQLAEAVEMSKSAPENLRVILPDEVISSYALVDEADVGVVYASTLGLEMACAGKQVLCMAQSTYAHVGCTRNLEQPSEYLPELLAALQAGSDPEIARRALRWAQVYFTHFALPFDLVDELPEFEAEVKYSSVLELRPGMNAALDEVIGRLLGERSMIPQASEAQKSASTLVENRFLADWVRPATGTPGAA